MPKSILRYQNTTLSENQQMQTMMNISVIYMAIAKGTLN